MPTPLALTPLFRAELLYLRHFHAASLFRFSRRDDVHPPPLRGQSRWGQLSDEMPPITLRCLLPLMLPAAYLFTSVQRRRDCR